MTLVRIALYFALAVLLAFLAAESNSAVVVPARVVIARPVVVRPAPPPPRPVVMAPVVTPPARRASEPAK